MGDSPQPAGLNVTEDLGGEGLRGLPVGGPYRTGGVDVGGHVVGDLKDALVYQDYHGAGAGIPVRAVPEALDCAVAGRVKCVGRPPVTTVS